MQRNNGFLFFCSSFQRLILSHFIATPNAPRALVTLVKVEVKQNENGKRNIRRGRRMTNEEAEKNQTEDKKEDGDEEYDPTQDEGGLKVGVLVYLHPQSFLVLPSFQPQASSPIQQDDEGKMLVVAPLVEVMVVEEKEDEEEKEKREEREEGEKLYRPTQPPPPPRPHIPPTPTTRPPSRPHTPPHLYTQKYEVVSHLYYYVDDNRTLPTQYRYNSLFCLY